MANLSTTNTLSAMRYGFNLCTFGTTTTKSCGSAGGGNNSGNGGSGGCGGGGANNGCSGPGDGGVDGYPTCFSLTEFMTEPCSMP